jgi:hypothetical protein
MRRSGPNSDWAWLNTVSWVVDRSDGPVALRPSWAPRQDEAWSLQYPFQAATFLGGLYEVTSKVALHDLSVHSIHLGADTVSLESWTGLLGIRGGSFMLLTWVGECSGLILSGGMCLGSRIIRC